VRMFMMLPYAGFLIVNYKAQDDNYSYTESLRQDLLNIESISISSQIVSSSSWLLDYMMYVYIAVGLMTSLGFVLLPLSFKKFTSRSSGSGKVAPAEESTS